MTSLRCAARNRKSLSHRLVRRAGRGTMRHGPRTKLRRPRMPGCGMKIVKLEDFHVDGGWDSYSFLKITTDKGLVGWAEFKESRRRGLAALIHGLGSTLIGEDPR